MLGTNDYKNRVSIKDFVANYRDMITHEIEEFGNCVILMAPIMMQDETIHSLLDDSIGLDGYRFATSNLAKEWNIPVIDLQKELANINPKAHYSDNVHLNW